VHPLDGDTAVSARLPMAEQAEIPSTARLLYRPRGLPEYLPQSGAGAPEETSGQPRAMTISAFSLTFFPSFQY
jgi:hypothetical protein